MSDNITKPRGWNPDRCRFIAETYLDWFLDYAVAEARKSGEESNVKHLKGLVQRFRESETSGPLLLQDSFFTCNQARLNKEWQENRQDHLIRLLIEPILPLFVEEGGPKPDKGGLSRTMLPGLFFAIRSAIGGEVLLDNQLKCTAIIDRLHTKVGDKFEWDDYFSDPEAQQISIHTLANMAHRFDDFEQGKQWFIETINKDLPGDSAVVHQHEANWHFGEDQFATFASHFFLPLIEAIFAGEDINPGDIDLDQSERDKIELFLSRIAW